MAINPVDLTCAFDDVSTVELAGREQPFMIPLPPYFDEVSSRTNLLIGEPFVIADVETHAGYRVALFGDRRIIFSCVLKRLRVGDNYFPGIIKKYEEVCMDRRAFLKNASVGAMVVGIAGKALAVEKAFPTKVDQSLFDTINRVKNPSNKTPLEKSHAPVISAPQTVKAGVPFTVEVSVGEVLHPMGETHWIEFITLEVGNEPAGRIDSTV